MRIDPNALRTTLEHRYGVALLVDERPGTDGQKIVLRPAEIPESHSFGIEVLLGWRSVEVIAASGTYSRDLVREMGKAGENQRTIFRGFLQTAIAKGGSVNFSLNGSDAHWEDAEIWDLVWERFHLRVGRNPVALNGTSAAEVADAVTPWVSTTLGSVLSLVPLEADDEEARREGAIREILATRYERDPINRALCLEIHGSVCKACGFDFGKSYGEAGEGFIEVHHTKQLSEQQGIEVAINPLTDLVPLCSNCHSMAHRRVPAFSVEELKTMFSKQDRSSSLSR